MRRADRFGRRLRSGVVRVNAFLVRDLTAPLGGVGISGIGREGGWMENLLVRLVGAPTVLGNEEAGQGAICLRHRFSVPTKPPRISDFITHQNSGIPIPK